MYSQSHYLFKRYLLLITKRKILFLFYKSYGKCQHFYQIQILSKKLVCVQNESVPNLSICRR